MLCVTQGLVYPGLDHSGVQHSTSVLHAHDLFDSDFERHSVGILVLSEQFCAVVLGDVVSGDS